MNSAQRVQKAVEFDCPDRVPTIYVNGDKTKSDIIMVDVEEQFGGVGKDQSEWGFVWDRRDDTMGQPKAPMIKDWQYLDNYTMPNPIREDRFECLHQEMETYGADKYYIGSLTLSGFTIMTFLRGFSELMEDLYLEREYVEQLADMVFDFEMKIIAQLKEQGCKGVAFFDDWGTQDRLLISPKMWREIFKPRYKKQFDYAHEQGLTVFFHCCGYVQDIIEDLVEIGVDMFNLSQPNLFDLDELGEKFGGKTCFVCPVSYQTTSISGTREEIFADVLKLYECFGKHKGGLIGYLEEYSSIGMSCANYQSCQDAFNELIYK